MYISSKDDLTVNPPHRSVPSIMAELGHTHIDILKVRFIDAIMQFIMRIFLSFKLIFSTDMSPHYNIGRWILKAQSGIFLHQGQISILMSSGNCN